MKNLSALKKGAAFIMTMALICAGFAVFTHKDAETDTAYANDVTYLTDDPDAPDVYMTTTIDANALVKIYDRLGFEPTGEVAVKMSTGEPPNSNYLRPELIGDLVRKVNGTIVECNTAYGGQRSSTVYHEQVIEDHGLNAISKGGKADIMDRDGDITIDVPTPPAGATSTITTNRVGAHLQNYDSLISLAHFKGHAMAGYGGAIKNMSIGIGSVAGKCLIHTGGSSSTSPWGGNQDRFLESMGDATSSVVNFFEGKVIYINVMNNLSVDCDCSGYPAAPQIGDIGILASYDPVALDQACIDLVSENNGTALINRINQRNGLHTLEHAEAIGLGSRSYNLIDIDNEEIPPEIPPETPTATMTYANGALTISDLEGEAKLIHASYTNGALSKVEITDAAEGTTNIPTRNGDKFMLWSTVGAMMPLCEPVTVETGTIDTVVVYFSATNTTEGVAQKIADYTGADMFELQPKIPYTRDDLSWTTTGSRVNTEHNDANRHVELVTTDVPNWDSYDIVYIGAPIWWGEFSWVIDEFVKGADFNGKTVIPFCTSMSSSLGQSAENLKAKSSSGNWLDGMRFGTSATESQVQNWIDGLNLN